MWAFQKNIRTILQKEQVRTETNDQLNQYEQYIVSVQEVFSCKVLVERWHFEVYHHVNKEKQLEVENTENPGIKLIYLYLNTQTHWCLL